MKLIRSLLVILATGGAIAAIAACGGDDSTDTTTGTAADAADDEIDAADAAAEFCAQYDTTCGFGNAFGGDPYSDLTDCTTRFNGYVSSRQSCVVQHLGFAAGGDKSTHCPHAEGLDQCD